MPSNINLVIKNKIKKKRISDRPTLIFFQHVTVNTHIFFLALEYEEVPSPANNKVVTEADPKFFDHVNNDVHKILQKEKMQEEYQKVGVVIYVQFTVVYMYA